MLLLFAGTVLAACPAPPAEVEAGIVRVEQAFAALDAEGVRAEGERLEVLAACLDRPIPPALAARLHGTEGVVAFVAGDPDRAATAFAAARRVDPAWTPDPTLIPKGHPIRALAVSIDPGTWAPERVVAPARGELLFDGEAATARPGGVPTVAQWVVDAAVVSGGYVWPDAPLPPYDAAGGGTPTPARPAAHPVVAWLGLGGASLAASATSLYVAGRARDAWAAAETGPEVAAHYRENHALVGVAAGFGVLAVVGGVGALASVEF